AYVAAVKGDGSLTDNSGGVFLVNGDGVNQNEGLGMIVEGDGGGENHGLASIVRGDYTRNRGIQVRAYGDNGTGGGIFGVPDNIGIEGETFGASQVNYGVHFTVSGASDFNFGLAANVNGAAVGGGSLNNTAVVGVIEEPTAGDNAGSNCIGVAGYILNPGDQKNYAVFGKHVSSTGTNSNIVNCSPCPIDFAGYFVGDVFCAQTYFYSDAKLKKDVKHFTNALGQLDKLEIKSYTFDRDKFPFMNLPQGPQIGVLTSDMKKVFPNLVKRAAHPADPFNKEDKEVEFESVNYNALIPILVQGVQELSATDKKVADKAKEQDAKIDELTKQVEDLKNLLNELCNNGCEGLQGSTPVKPNGDAILYQSIPNPTPGSATINYNITTSFNSALITISTVDGKVVREYPITHQGAGSIVFEKNDRSDNAYKYSLIVDGKVYDTKSIVITRN
ncbi:MAG: tail fiber domain-containing protein, partial [Bacteroidota bacterium]